ncbi:hypothetical protein [Stratiformator vulcanicus]|uniref:Uncharacterized protein n=1 Tax=Stratiformator vulcanicus TaxID=2527980 RepID=A0A517R718_9PLAN|nr:hypothetical protein [Stratiformator vulcanicus]QDT39669.1 hypothetical protein Pan189_40780 [Stratiformator vulcanicus]
MNATEHANLLSGTVLATVVASLAVTAPVLYQFGMLDPRPAWVDSDCYYVEVQIRLSDGSAWNIPMKATRASGVTRVINDIPEPSSLYLLYWREALVRDQSGELLGVPAYPSVRLLDGIVAEAKSSGRIAEGSEIDFRYIPTSLPNSWVAICPMREFDEPLPPRQRLFNRQTRITQVLRR